MNTKSTSTFRVLERPYAYVEKNDAGYTVFGVTHHRLDDDRPYTTVVSSHIFRYRAIRAAYTWTEDVVHGRWPAPVILEYLSLHRVIRHQWRPPGGAR